MIFIPYGTNVVLQLTELPEDHLYVGTTTLTIDDIRKFNYLQSTYYELHKNDCRYCFPKGLSFYVLYFIDITQIILQSTLQELNECLRSTCGTDSGQCAIP